MPPGRIAVNSEDTVMPIHAQKGQSYLGGQFSGSHGFNSIYVLRKTDN